MNEQARYENQTAGQKYTNITTLHQAWPITICNEL